MRKRDRFVSLLLGGVIVSGVAMIVAAQSADEMAIREVIERYDAAIKAKDLDKIMSCYVPDESLVVFDAIPPRQYVGAKAYRKDNEDFLAAFPGPIDIKRTGLSISVDRNLAFTHMIEDWTLTDKESKQTHFVFRVTDVYRKIRGHWLIVHEHVSWPVDPTTGKADLLSKP